MPPVRDDRPGSNGPFGSDIRRRARRPGPAISRPRGDRRRAGRACSDRARAPPTVRERLPRRRRALGGSGAGPPGRDARRRRPGRRRARRPVDARPHRHRGAPAGARAAPAGQARPAHRLRRLGRPGDRRRRPARDGDGPDRLLRAQAMALARRALPSLGGRVRARVGAGGGQRPARDHGRGAARPAAVARAAQRARPQRRAPHRLAVVRYLQLYRRRRATILLRMVAAFTLLAEAMVAVAFGRNWHATWWEWHVLMLAAFALIAWSAHREWHEERFSDLYLDETGSAPRDISVLFADLQGFTRFSEEHAPSEVSAMLNAYFARAIPPIVQRQGGEIDRIVGDALMATFNGRGDQPNHAERAARAALAIQRSTAALAAEHPQWPRFRVGVNTGSVALTVLGTGGGRTHTAIGDAVNLAARLEGTAPVGGVAVGPETLRRLPRARTRPPGLVHLKGKAEPVEGDALIRVPGE